MKITLLFSVFLALFAGHRVKCADKTTMANILKEIDIYIKELKDEKTNVDKKETTKESFSSNHINDAIQELEKALDEENKKHAEQKKDAVVVEKNEKEDELKDGEIKDEEDIKKILDNYITDETEKSDEQIINEEYEKFQAEKDEKVKKDIENDNEIFNDLINDESEDVKKAINATEEICEDSRKIGKKRCEDMAKKGFCSIYPTQMKKRCKRTCKICCGDDTIFCSTLSKASLKVIERTCQSKKYHKLLNLRCPKTCRFCGHSAQEPPCVRTDYGCCWDSSIAKDHVGTITDGCPACKDNKGLTFCQRFHPHCDDKLLLPGKQVRSMCPRTCGLCGPHKKCQDKPSLQDSCMAMRHNDAYGYSPCVTNYHVMKYNCAKTCGICQKSTIECGKTQFGCCNDGKTISRSIHKENCKECADSPDPKMKCEFWGNHGICLSHEDYMRDVCPGTCAFCLNKK